MKLKYSSPEVLWEKTQELLVKSVLASDEWSEDKLKYKEDNGFSFLGPDVAIDNEGKPFLLEINAFPTTSVSTPLGVQLKLQMLTDMYRMLGVGGYNDAGRRYGKYVKERIQTYCNDPKYDKRKKQKKKKRIHPLYQKRTLVRRRMKTTLTMMMMKTLVIQSNRTTIRRKLVIMTKLVLVVIQRIVTIIMKNMIMLKK